GNMAEERQPVRNLLKSPIFPGKKLPAHDGTNQAQQGAQPLVDDSDLVQFFSAVVAVLRNQRKRLLNQFVGNPKQTVADIFLKPQLERGPGRSVGCGSVWQLRPAPQDGSSRPRRRGGPLPPADAGMRNVEKPSHQGNAA